jgi:hypothetical protein
MINGRPSKKGVKMKSIVVLFLLLILTVSAGAFDIRSGGTIAIPSQDTVNDDLLATGSQVDVSGRINGNAFVVGNSVNVTGPVNGFLAAAGQTVRLRGQKGTVSAAGQNVQVQGLTARNVALAGNTIIVDSNTNVSRDLMAAGNTLNINGTIGRNLRIAGTNLSIRSTVNGNVNAAGQNISVLPGTVIRGNFTYESPNQANISENAQILGQVTRRPMEKRRPAFGAGILGSFLWFLAMLAFGALFVAIFPGWSARSAERLRAEPGWSALWGLIVLIITPIAIILAIITIIGIPIAIASLAGYIVALMLATIITSLAIGALILRRSSVWLQLLVGLILVFILSAIPYVGVAIKLAVLIFGLGAMVLSFVRPRERLIQGTPHQERTA